MQASVEVLQALYDQLRTQVDLLNENIEPSQYLFFLFSFFLILGFIFTIYHPSSETSVP